MDKKPSEPAVFAPRPNGRSAIPLVINKDGRKPLFQHPSKENLRAEARSGMGRNAYSDGSSLTAAASYDRRSGAVSPTPSMTSSNGDGPSRIPRPSSAAGVFSKARQQISLSEAYRMAEAEEKPSASGPRTVRLSPAPVDGSPSPAPRPRPSSRVSDHAGSRRPIQHRSSFDVGRADYLRKSPGGYTYDDDTIRSVESTSSSGSFDRRLSQYADAHQRPSFSPSPRLSLQSLPGRSSRNPEAGQTLSKKASHGSLSHSPRTQAFSKGHVPKGWVAHLLAQEDLRAASPNSDRQTREHAADGVLPSIETESPPQEPTPPTSRPASAEVDDHPSPNKSYAWQVDQDFTAGDLQVSDSPRINTAELERDLRGFDREQLAKDGRRDKLSRKQASGLMHEKNGPDKSHRREGGLNEELVTSPQRHKNIYNTKLDEIRQREQELARQAEPSEEAREVRKNTKLDEIREREKTYLSKRALASNRLDDIREQNSMSRSLSPEQQPKPQKSSTGSEATPHKICSSAPAEVGERIPNTPVTIFRNARGGNDDQLQESGLMVKSQGEPHHSQPTTRHARSDSRDLLRMLARAASASPVPENGKAKSSDAKTPDKDNADEDEARALKSESHKTTEPEDTEADKLRPSVGFAGVPRSPSIDSAKDKRSSRAMSDNDPTDRIEGEMKLFALIDNQSERGSVRASSVGPPTDDEDDKEDEPTEEMPRPTRTDLIPLPTPKVVGAFVETPATIKMEDHLPSSVPDEGPTTTATQNKSQPTPRPPSDRSRSRPRSKLFVSETYDESEPAMKNPPVAFEPVSSIASAGLRRRRTRSLPRSRGPLINSVKPPSVKDDLLEIQRTYQIEDSTLDDFEKLLTDSKMSLPFGNVDRVVDEVGIKQEGHNGKDNSELERYDRMSKTLNDGLMGIRTAKMGIERLEGNLAHHDHQLLSWTLSSDGTPLQLKEAATASASKRPSLADEKLQSDSRSSKQQPSERLTSRLTPPLLYHRQPFRLTLLGMLVSLLGIWFVAETAMCACYCRPTSCPSSSSPCPWEPTDPLWGAAIPVKIDQWLSDGEGLRLYERFMEDASDLYRGGWEHLTGSDIGNIDVDALGLDGKRRHRRRLHKNGGTAASTLDGQARGNAAREAQRGMQHQLEEAEYDLDDQESFAADESV